MSQNVKPQIKEILDAKFEEVRNTAPTKRAAAEPAKSSAKPPSKESKPSNTKQQPQPKQEPAPPQPQVEEETNELSCDFCGKVDPAFENEEELDIHLTTDCPLLTECVCQQVIEIMGLNKHLLEECEKKSQYKQCPRCKEAIKKTIYDKHIDEDTCRAEKDPNQFVRCVLCKVDVPPQKWKHHLMYICSNNERQKRVK